MDSAFGREERRINWNNSVVSSIHTATSDFGACAKKTPVRIVTAFLEYLYDNKSGDAKAMEERLTKAKASSQEKWKENGHTHTKFWFYLAYNNRRLFPIWCGEEFVTECLFFPYLSCYHKIILPRSNFT